MGETRRMHFVPRTYLQNFSSKRKDEYHIHAYSKSGGNIFTPNIDNVCIETDLYMLPGETEEKRQLLEDMYEELYEKDYPNIYNLLIDKTKVTLTKRERYSIISFVVSMFYRIISWHNFHHETNDAILEKIYNLSKENGSSAFFFEEEEISIVGKSLEQLQKEARTESRPAISLTTAQLIFRLIRLRTINDVVMVVKARPGFEFLTSDNPVSFKSENIKHRPIPFDPSNTLSIPIDSNHLLQLHPWKEKVGDWRMLGRMSDMLPGYTTSMNNNFQYNQCSRFLLGSETAVKSFKANPFGIFPNR